MKTNIIKYGTTDLEARVLHECEIIKEFSKVVGSSDGGTGQPAAATKRLGPFVEEIRLKSQAISDLINKELLYKSSVDRVVQDKAATDKQLHDNHHQLTIAQEQRIAAEAVVKRLQPAHGKRRMIAVWAATGAVTLMEGILSEPIFENFGYSTLEASAAALLFAATLATTAHLLPSIIGLGKTTFQRRLIAGTAIGTLTALFSFMAFHRAAYVEAQMAHEGIGNFHVSPISFILLSWLLFGVAAAIHYFYYPSKADREQQRQYNNAQTAKQECDETCQWLAKEHTAITTAHNEVRSQTASKMELGYMLERIVITAAHESIAIYKKFNLLARPDGSRPVCFDEPYTMQFNTHFQSLKDL